MFESKCKSCMESMEMKRHILKDQINDAIDKMSKNKKIKFVSDDVYKDRLLQCSECKYLELGTTCMQCGCYVEIRAKLRDASCPLPKNKRWKSVK